MSSLTTVEKKRFEDIFGMSGGYVLDLNNGPFAELFRKTVNVNVYDEKYSFNGDSKAKRLRAFWEIESDIIVGKILFELLEVWKYNQSKNGAKGIDQSYQECLKTVERLQGKQIKEENQEEQFLKKEFGKISLEKLQIDSALIPILESRISEADKCLKAGASLSVIFLCGSVLEGILLGIASKNPRQFNQASNSPKDKDGKVKYFQDWTLSQFIDIAHELGLLKLDVKKFSHDLRDFRNYIHPYQQMVSNFNPDKHTAEICRQVLKAAIACLSGDRK